MTEESAVAEAQPSQGTRLVFGVLSVLLLLLLIPTLFFPLGAGDFWFHVATGDWILAQGELPTQDPFAHTTEGKTLLVHGWLADVVLAGTRKLLGYAGLRLLTGFWLAGALVCYGLLLRRFGWSPPLAAVLPALVLVLFADRLRLRPDLVSFLGFPLFLLGLDHWRTAGKLLCRAGALTLLGVALWVNMHPAVMLCPVLAGALWLGERLFVKNAEGRLPWQVPLLLLLATFVHPSGPKLYLYSLDLGSVAQYVGEWKSSWAYFRYPSRWILALAPWGLLIVVLGALKQQGLQSEQRRGLFLSLLCWGYALLKARFLYLLFVPMLFLPRTWRAPTRSLGLAAGLALLAISSLISVRGEAIHYVLQNPTQNLRPDLPRESARFLSEGSRALRLWHPQEWGGFLADRGGAKARIFADGRLVLYGAEHIKKQVLLETNPRRVPSVEFRSKLRARKEALLEEYRVEALVVRPGFWPRGGAWFRVLAAPNNWLFLHRQRAQDLLGEFLERCVTEGVQLPKDLSSEAARIQAEDAIARAQPEGP